MPTLSKNVVRSIKTDIKNKREKADKLSGQAQVLTLESEALEKFLEENNEQEKE